MRGCAFCWQPTNILKQNGLAKLNGIFNRAKEVTVGEFDHAQVAIHLHVPHPFVGLTLRDMVEVKEELGPGD